MAFNHKPFFVVLRMLLCNSDGRPSEPTGRLWCCDLGRQYRAWVIGKPTHTHMRFSSRLSVLRNHSVVMKTSVALFVFFLIESRFFLGGGVFNGTLLDIRSACFSTLIIWSWLTEQEVPKQARSWKGKRPTCVHKVRLRCLCEQTWLYAIVYIISPADIVWRALAVGGGEPYMPSWSPAPT